MAPDPAEERSKQDRLPTTPESEGLKTKIGEEQAAETHHDSVSSPPVPEKPLAAVAEEVISSDNTMAPSDARATQPEKKQAAENQHINLVPPSGTEEISVAVEKLILDESTTTADDLEPNNNEATLLGLPYEIRKKILKYLLLTELQENRHTGYRAVMGLVDDTDANEDIDSRRLWSMYNDPHDFLDTEYVLTGGYTLHPSILWTCKKLFREGSEVLVEDNKYIALKYPAIPETIGSYIKLLMVKSGLETFWENPGIFKSTSSTQGRPVVTINLEHSESESKSENWIFVPFQDLGKLSQVVAGYRGHFNDHCMWNMTDGRGLPCPNHFFMCPPGCKNNLFSVEKPVLKIKLDIDIALIPAWKQKGFAVLTEDLQQNLFDWICDSIIQIVCKGVPTGLRLEADLENWIVHQGTLRMSLTSTEWNARYLRLFRSRFRNAESQFFSGDIVAAYTSFATLNTMISFSHWGCKWSKIYVRPLRELATWTHFYMALSLVEQADTAYNLYNYRQCYAQLNMASMRMPDLENWKDWNDPTLTPGQESRLYFAKAEAWCIDPWMPDRCRRCWFFLAKTLQVVVREYGLPRCIEMNRYKEAASLVTRGSFTMLDFEDIKDGMKSLLLEVFGPLEPARLHLQPKDNHLDQGSETATEN